MKRYEIHRSDFQDLEGFFTKFGQMVNGSSGYFGKDLHSFDDCLFGGFGLITPCEIVWNGSAASRLVLDQECYAKWCQKQIKLGEYPDQRGLTNLKLSLQQALEKKGPTMFELLVDTIRSVEK